MRILLFAVLAAFAAALQRAPGGEVAEFRQIAQNLAAAYLPGDWTSTDYRGRIWTKANVLAMFDGQRPPMTKAEIDVERVRLLGDVAIVSGRSVSAGEVDGRAVDVTQRFTDIYVRRD